ncbi:MAG: MBL fold metallo-hydrolase [Aquificaceae bacterium]|nr:MAG: MBL fold metallo-hydrolase [Aquificaceae bacterium]
MRLNSKPLPSEVFPKFSKTPLIETIFLSMKLYFLGTAGGRTVTFKRIRNSGGILLKAGRELIHIDPGPGGFINFFSTPFEPWKDLTAVVLSHLHLDHSADANSILESATESGKRKGVKLLAPKDALFGESRVVLPYIQNLVEVETLKEFESYKLKEVTLKVLHKHRHHRVEVYSLLFEWEGKRVVYVPCGKFESYWLDFLPEGVELMIFNSTFYTKREDIDHLSIPDVVEILKIKKPKKAVITHYSLEMLTRNPVKVAKEVSSLTGVETLPAQDLMVLEI